MNELIIFADRHDDIAPILALTKCLPALKQKGFNTLFLELPSTWVSFEHTFDTISKMVNALELFDREITNATVLTTQQQNFIRESGLDINIINYYIKHENIYLASNKSLLKLLVVAQENNMNVVNIDVPEPGIYLNNPKGIEKRNFHMLSCINKALRCDLNTKGILLVGPQHCANVWLTRYNRSLLQWFLITTPIKIHQPIFFIYSLDDQIVSKFREILAGGGPFMQSVFQEIKLGKNQEALNQFPEIVIQKLAEQKFISQQKSLDNINEYWILKPANTELTNDLVKYLEDLGAIDVKSTTLIKFNIDSKILKKEVRSTLGLDRVSIKALSDEGKTFLQQNIPGITIEKDLSTMDENKWWLTFVDDKNTINPKKNRDYINDAINIYRSLTRKEAGRFVIH